LHFEWRFDNLDIDTGRYKEAKEGKEKQRDKQRGREAYRGRERQTSRGSNVVIVRDIT
tara:strand:+ start:909 stop:1082 length:174 start_codon:yes stop_codon:yes gene_type:complete